MNETSATQPEHHRRCEHEDARYAECDPRADVLEQPWREQAGHEGAEIDGEVEPAEDLGKKVLVRRSELIAHVGRDAGFDPARPDRDQRETDRQAHTSVVDRESKMPEAVDDRQRDDRPILAQQTVGEQCTDQWKEIDGGAEQVVIRACLGIAHGSRAPVGGKQMSRHEDDQDGAHPVVAEAFGGLVTDDVGNPGGKLATGRGGRTVR